MVIEGMNIHVKYGDYLAVKEMDICIDKNEITTIIGPNGSGKSTVLKALTRLLKMNQGTVSFDGKAIHEYGNKELARRIGVLPQRHNAPTDFRVKELVSYGRMPHQKFLGGMSREDKEIVDWAMKVTEIYDLRNKSIMEISGGESQRVWIATVLAQKPEVLFLDEPTTYLDIMHQLDTMRLVKNLNRETGIGVVMVLHDLSHAMEVSDRIIVIKEGKKYSEGKPEEVITPYMMREVYDVECSVINITGRQRPTLVYAELA